MPSVFDRFGKFLEVFQFLSQVDPDDVGKALEYSKVLLDEQADLQAKVLAAIKLMDIITDYVPGEGDDRLVDAIHQLAETEQVWLLVESINEIWSQGNKMQAIGAVQDRHPKALQIDEHKAIPWDVVIQVVGLILTFINSFSRKPESQKRNHLEG